ncbi:MAG: thiolase family protein [Deltaproteobacteria bacterium]|nr:thiolase family protein [Deltaproteobacteria bacterium]
MGDAYIIDAVRTPVGRRNGALSGVRADELAAATLSEIINRTGIDPSELDDVVMGCVTQLHEQGINVARNAALIAGFPVGVTGTTVNRLCGSSQQALNFAAMGVASGHQDLVIAAGVESMSRITMGSDMFLQGEMVTPSPKMSWKYNIIPQGLSAELVAERFDLTREELDAFSYESHQRAAAADDAGKFDRETISMDVHNEEKGAFSFSNDEGIRRSTTIEKLGSLKPAFKEDGVITAASSSQISDGSAAIMIASKAAVEKYGLKPRAKIVSMATAGVDPTIMLTAPIGATQRALARAGLNIGDLGAIELNEAFASVALGCGRELGMDFAKVNVYGGAIALGHPHGASGARLITTLLNVLEEKDERYGLSTMCIGFGQGIATIIDRDVN